MSYDLAVWEGRRPATNADALAAYEEMMRRYEGDSSGPSSAIERFVASLLARWPDLDDDGGEESPWADSPLIANASGAAIYFSLATSRALPAIDYASATAARQGLVCFDPQRLVLLPEREGDGAASGSASRPVDRGILGDLMG